jgi:hypothetical protein
LRKHFNFTNPVEYDIKRVEIWTLSMKVYKTVCVCILDDFPWKMFSRQLFNQLMDQYVGKLHFVFRICEILLVKHHTPFKTVPALLIAKSENMARIYHHLYELLLLIHWKIGDISLEEGPDYWYLAEHLSRKIVKYAYTWIFTSVCHVWDAWHQLTITNHTAISGPIFFMYGLRFAETLQFYKSCWIWY